MNKELSCIILAAGKGTRMKSDHPKVMHQLAGWPLIKHVVHTCESLKANNIITVIADGMDDVAATVAPHKTAIQKQQLGTGDAARAGLSALKDAKGYVLIALGDVPLVRTQTYEALIAAAYKTGMSVLAMRPADASGYGRIVTDKKNNVTSIVEDKECDEKQKKIDLVNAGCFVVPAEHINNWLGALKTNNAQKEYYLTDIIKIAAKEDVPCAYVEAEEAEVMGINSRAQLAEAEVEVQSYLRARALFAGATLMDPTSVYFSMDTALGRDVVIEPNVFFAPGVTVADHVTIHAFSHLEGCVIEEGASIGPFARIRPQSRVGEKATIGNFVEVNRSTVKAGAKSKHMSYLGDAVIGEKANIGAGTVIANYDGFDKQETTIGKGVFIGSNSTLIAPLTIGDGAYVAAGSAITTSIPKDALAVARAREVLRDGWADQYRSKKSESKKGK